MNCLQQHIIESIKSDGPMPISRYMGIAMGHPRWGYYINHDPFGIQGDFITSPEISQMFGELIGLWCVERWQSLDQPDPFILAELGPGRGTLMSDALRAASVSANFTKAVEVHLIETSPTLSAIQKKILGDQGVYWHERIADLPAEPIIFIANEFFDALPISQLERTDKGWHERVVEYKNEKLSLVLNKEISSIVPFLNSLQYAPVGAILEFSQARTNVMVDLAEIIMKNGGAALIIDYGHNETAIGDTLQGLKHHKYADILETPGEIDITAHVDFGALKQISRDAGAQIFGPTTQSAFLRQLGIVARAKLLQHKANTKQAAAIDNALHRLINEGEMGQLFKVMAIGKPGNNQPPGFMAP